MANKKWLDEDPELIAEIFSEEKRIDSLEVRRSADNPFRWMVGIISVLPMALFWKGRWTGPIIEGGTVEKLGSFAFALFMIAGLLFFTRKEKGHVDVYPEMVVFCDYDPYRKEARPSHFFYWKDIVQYHRKEPYIWLESKDNAPQEIWISIKKLRPYLKQYAPHAKEVNFNMDDYWRYRLKENRPEDKSLEEIAIEVEMAANREKAKKVLAGAKDVTTAIEDVEKKRASEEAEKVQKAKDFWNKYPEE